MLAEVEEEGEVGGLPGCGVGCHVILHCSGSRRIILSQGQQILQEGKNHNLLGECENSKTSKRC